ncbi:uncharacterized protein LOC143290521 isoform X2 [Babylonia areolata]|uniref:uncharacterized protein LOC143290521 isoform X2 n=1 Tax=Babylonia areolata TaxID=304850 RepID=UPI003FD1E872
MHGVRLKQQKTDLDVFFSQAVIGQPSSSASKLTDHGFLDHSLDMSLVEDIGTGFVDSLGDASMDSFTDLSGILMEPNFLEQPELREEEEDSTPLTLLNLDADMKAQQYSLKCQFTQADDGSPDLARLSASVGLKRSRTPSLDHDYSTKRARLSPTPTPSPATVCVESADEHCLVPEVSSISPGPSTSGTSECDKRKQRREKNNIASKRSREIRKKKFQNMEGEEKRLCEENARLERLVEQMEQMAQKMKETLVTKLKIKT